MSFTKEQKAYHLRKMRTRISRLDINKDGFISREDFELMGKKVAEQSGMKGEQAEATKNTFLKIADVLNLKSGVKIPLEEAAKKANESLWLVSLAERSAILHDTHNLLFDAIDTNKDGHISVKEFKVYMSIFAPGTTEDEIDHSFHTTDANKDGEISCEEFIAAAEDFILGVEETELSKVFLGRLLD